MKNRLQGFIVGVLLSTLCFWFHDQIFGWMRQSWIFGPAAHLAECWTTGAQDLWSSILHWSGRATFVAYAMVWMLLGHIAVTFLAWKLLPRQIGKWVPVAMLAGLIIWPITIGAGLREVTGEVWGWAGIFTLELLVIILLVRFPVVSFLRRQVAARVRV